MRMPPFIDKDRAAVVIDDVVRTRRSYELAVDLATTRILSRD
jgi:hypothetical protein